MIAMRRRSLRSVAWHSVAVLALALVMLLAPAGHANSSFAPETPPVARQSESVPPGAPESFSTTPADGQVTLTWRAPSSGGGAAVTGYEYRHAEGATVPAETAWTSAGTNLTATIGGLANGTAYTFEVRALSGPIAGPVARVRATPATVPAAPQDLRARGTDGRVDLVWSAPASDGGSDLVRYEVRYAAGASVPQDTEWYEANPYGAFYVAGLDNGTAYTFEVRAVNGVGEGEAAAVTATPAAQATAPGVPQNLRARATAGTVTLTWRAPSSGGGAAVTGYEYRHAEGATVSAETAWTSAGTNLTATIGSLANGTAYTFEVRALSGPIAGPVARTQATPATVPAAPQDLRARGTDGRVDLVWSAPASDGGSDLVRYEVRYAAGASVPQDTEWYEANLHGAFYVAGLKNGTAYTFEVRAVNGRGDGAAARIQATPVLVPPAPQSLAATPADGQVVLTWRAAAGGGGAAVTGYEYRHAEGATVPAETAWTSAGTNLTATIGSLANGTAYTFEVRALSGPIAGPVARVRATPATVPSAPQHLRARGTDGRVDLVWSAPASDGGSDLVRYEVRYAKGASVPQDTEWYEANPYGAFYVAGLANGTAHTFEVRAVNGVGEGEVAAVTTTPAAPGVPRNLSAEATTRSVTLSWMAPTGGDGAIVGYRIEVSYDDGAVWAEVEDNTNETSTAFLHGSGLTSGETRRYRVTAITNQGAGPASVAAVANATQIVPGLTATGKAVEDTPEGVAAINLCWEGAGVTLSDLSSFSIRKRMVHSSFPGDWGSSAWIPLGVLEPGDCKEGVVGYRVSGSLASNVPYAFQFRARKGSGWALSNVAEGVSVDSARQVRADVMAGDSDLSGDTVVPDTVCRDYDDPATPEDEQGAFIVNIGFSTLSPALLFYEEVIGFVPDDDLTLENATAELIARPYDVSLGYRVRITPTNWGEPVAVRVPAGAVTHAESSVSNQASNVFRRDTSDSTECAAGSTSTVYRARVRRAEILEDRDRSGEWSRGERVRATLTFEERVAVTTEGGVPSVSLDFDGETVQASYVRGTGTKVLEFVHVVTQAQGPVREVELLEDSLALNGCAIASLNGPAVELSHSGATAGGRRSRTRSAAMRSVTVADAEVEEGAGAELAFAVKLDGPASYRITVDYATSDGTATAGEDYTQTSGTLGFAAGETSKTVSVPVLDDAHDEGNETLTLTLSNPSGAYLADGEAVGTITNTDVMPRAWLARFGRTVADQVLDAVDGRMTARAVPGTQVTLAGRRIGAAAAAELAALDAKARREAPSEWFGGVERAPGSRAVTVRDLLVGSSFALTGGTAETGFGTVWGRGAVTRFDGREGALTLDGEVGSVQLGADFSRGRGTLGVVLSHSRGEGGYRAPPGDGEVESTLSGVYPWGRYALSERVSAWGVVGYGAGKLTLTPGGMSPIETDMDLAMAAVGGRGVVAKAPEAGGLELAAKTDVLVVRTTSDEVRGSAGSLAGSEAQVTRLRLGLEGTWRGLGTEGGGTFLPTIELGVRHDGGDAETGFGADIGAGLAWVDRSLGIEAALNARGLLTHESDGFRERGFAGSLVWDPTPESDHGPSLTLSQTAGASASGGMDALLAPDTARALGAPGDGEELRGRRLEARLGYGWPSFGGRCTMTPEFGIALSDASREYIHAWRLEGPRAKDTAFELRFEVARNEAANDDATGHRVGVSMGARW